MRLERQLASAIEVAEWLAARPEVQTATPRLYVTGIVAAGDTSSGVRSIGIDPASAASAPFNAPPDVNAQNKWGLVAGTPLTADDRTGMLVGR